MRLLVALLVLASCTHKEEEPTSTSTGGQGVMISSILSDAGSPEKCASTEKALETLIASMPSACDKDDDCGGYYLHDTDVCKGSTMLHVPGCPPALKPQLMELHNQLRSYCPPPPTCEPKDYRAVCRAGRCVDALKTDPADASPADASMRPTLKK